MPMTSDSAFADVQKTYTWPKVVNALLKSFITDEILPQAYQEVTQAQKRPKKRVGDFIFLLQDLFIRFHGVFPQAELENLEFRGMKPASRSRIQHAVNNLPYREKKNLPKIGQLAMKEDNAQREQMTDFSVASFSVTKGGRKASSKANRTMQIGGQTSRLGMPSPPLTPSNSQPPSVLDEPHPSNHAHDPVEMVNSAAGMT